MSSTKGIVFFFPKKFVAHSLTRFSRNLFCFFPDQGKKNLFFFPRKSLPLSHSRIQKFPTWNRTQSQVAGSLWAKSRINLTTNFRKLLLRRFLKFHVFFSFQSLFMFCFFPGKFYTALTHSNSNPGLKFQYFPRKLPVTPQNCPWQFVLKNCRWKLRFAVAILERVPVKLSQLPLANFKKSARARPKVAVAIFNTNFATGFKKFYWKKKHCV